jgi:hypothetical protein
MRAALMPAVPQIEVPRVNETFVFGKCDYFLEARLWPLTQRLDPRRWMSNFLPDEREHAISLLNSFLYFDKILMEHLLLGAFQALSRSFCGAGESFLGTQAKWRSFTDSAIITCVRGETPNPTDSGYTFLRMARQVLGVNEDRIMEPDSAVDFLLKKPCPVVFLDDFVGSGQQFISTWKRQVPVIGHVGISFETLSLLLRNSQFFYCPLVCTAYGKQKIQTECPAVNVRPAHIISDEYGAFARESVLWPAELRASAAAFVERASSRAGIPNWKGFHDLGLALAFEHSVPDATLPILYWRENGWKPLIART